MCTHIESIAIELQFVALEMLLLESLHKYHFQSIQREGVKQHPTMYEPAWQETKVLLFYQKHTVKGLFFYQ